MRAVPTSARTAHPTASSRTPALRPQRRPRPAVPARPTRTTATRPTTGSCPRRTRGRLPPPPPTGSAGGRLPASNPVDYRGRNVVELAFAHLKQWRGLAARHDKHALTYRGAAVYGRSFSTSDDYETIPRAEGVTAEASGSTPCASRHGLKRALDSAIRNLPTTCSNTIKSRVSCC